MADSETDRNAPLYVSIPKEVKAALDEYKKTLGVSLSVAANLMLRRGLATTGLLVDAIGDDAP